MQYNMTVQEAENLLKSLIDNVKVTRAEYESLILAVKIIKDYANNKQDDNNGSIDKG